MHERFRDDEDALEVAGGSGPSDSSGAVVNDMENSGSGFTLAAGSSSVAGGSGSATNQNVHSSSENADQEGSFVGVSMCICRPLLRLRDVVPIYQQPECL